MMNEAKMNELTQAEDMAYFRADLCLYSPESYSLDEKKENDTHSCPRLFTGRCGNGPWRREQCVRQARFIGGAKMS